MVAGLGVGSHKAAELIAAVGAACCLVLCSGSTGNAKSAKRLSALTTSARRHQGHGTARTKARAPRLALAKRGP